MMGRKDLTEQRTAEILETFGRCVVKYGLDVSLEQIAEEAGMTRSIIRHYIGNREDVMYQLIEKVTTEYLDWLRVSISSISSERRIQFVLDYLFTENPTLEMGDKLILDVLMTAKERYPTVKQRLIVVFEEQLDIITTLLCEHYPDTDRSQCREVAYGVLCLSMSNSSFLWLGMKRQYNTLARQQALVLIHTLGTRTSL